MSLPNVIIKQSNGNLGIVAQSDDSISAIVVSGVAITGKVVLGDILGPFTSLPEVEALGITTAYDNTNTCLAHKQIADFYSKAPKGTKLYVMVVAKTVTLAQMCDKAQNYAYKIATQATQGRPRIIIVTRVPDGAYTPTYANQLDGDITAAITKAQETVVDLASQYIYSRFIIEGRDWQGNVSSTLNMRDSATTPNANRVAVALGQDNAFSISLAVGHLGKKYAFAGLVGGTLASLPVQRNIGRVLNGPIGITSPGYSNAAANNTILPVQQDTLNDKGFIFLRSFEGQAGYYFNMDHTAVALTDDYNNLRYGRVADKAALQTYATYTKQLNDEIFVSQLTGKMKPAVIKSLEGIIEKDIRQNMDGEISGVTAFIDADQNVLSSDNINVELSIIPKGNAGKFTVTIGLVNPFK